MALFDRIRYWDIWYDKTSLALSIGFIVLVLVAGTAAFFAFNHPAATVSEIPISTGGTGLQPTQAPQQSSGQQTPTTQPSDEQDSNANKTREAIPLSSPTFTNSTLNQTARDCIGDITTAKSKIDFLRDQLKSAETDLNRAKDRVRRTTDDIDRTQEQLNAQNLSSSEARSLQRRINSLQDDLSRDNEDFHREEDVVNSAQDEVNKAKKELQDAEDECRKQDILSVTLAQADTVTRDMTKDPHIANCAAAIDAANQQRDKAENDLSRAQDDLDREQRDLSRLETQLTDEQDKLDNLQANSSEETVRAQRDFVQNLQRRVDNQKKDVDDAQQAVQRAEDNLQEVDDVTKEIKDICRTQLAKSNVYLQLGMDPKQIEQIQDCTEAKDKSASLAKAASKAHDDSQTDLQDRRDDLSKAQTRLDQAEARLTNATKNNSTNTTTDTSFLEDSVRRAQRDVDNAQRDVDDAVDFEKQMRDALSEAKLVQKRVNDRCGK